MLFFLFLFSQKTFATIQLFSSFIIIVLFLFFPISLFSIIFFCFFLARIRSISSGVCSGFVSLFASRLNCVVVLVLHHSLFFWFVCVKVVVVCLCSQSKSSSSTFFFFVFPFFLSFFSLFFFISCVFRFCFQQKFSKFNRTRSLNATRRIALQSHADHFISVTLEQY